MALELSLSVCDYDRTAAIFDGRAPIEGCDVTAVSLVPEESFHRAFKFQEFDVTEISMSSYLLSLARGDAHYVAIPAFVSRLFRHSSIYIRTDRGIKTPQDLKGKTIGVPEYQMTANVWVRGMLEEEYGVKPRDIKWRRGGLEDPGREERARIKLPDEIDLKAVPTDRSLSDMLEKGELDGVIGARAPSCFLRGAPNVGRLFPDYPAVEEAYFKKTRLFPIMHAIGIRRSLVEKYPWVAVNVYKAFIKAKALCMHELGRDRASARHPAVAGPCLRSGPQDHGRGLLALWRAREQAAAGNAGALFVRAGPVGAAGAARRDVRQADV